MEEAKGKQKKSDLDITHEIHALHPDPDYHAFHIEHKVQLSTGLVAMTIVCDDCPQRSLIMGKAIPGFHAVRKAKSK